MGKALECSPQESEFARLRAEGNDQVTSYRLAFDEHDKPQKNAIEAAARVAKRPQVVAMMRELYRVAKKSQLLSHAQWLGMMIDAFQQSMEEGNKTAAASFGRLMGAGIGALTENINIGDSGLSNDQLIDKLAGDNPTLAAALRKHLSARDDFDA